MTPFRARFWLSIACLALMGGSFVAFLGSIDAVGSSSEEASAPETAPAGEHDVAKSAGAAPDNGCLANASAIEDIRADRQRIEDDRKELAAKEAELKAREQALNEELKKLEQARAEIDKVDALHKHENEEKVAKLVEALEAMNPKAGSQLLADLDETLAVTAMQRLSTAKLAKIMNLMEPARSSRLSEVLAGVARARSIASAGGASSRAENADNAMNDTKGGGK